MSDRSHAKRLWEDYGKRPDERRQIEEAAARVAGIDPAWHAVMWIPPERMRLKSALVLVDDQNLIDTMLNRERSPRGQGRGSEIYDAHRDLWALEVFVHPEVRLNDDARDALLGAIAEQLHIQEWDDHGAPVRPDDVARRRAGEQLGLTRRQEAELKDLVRPSTTAQLRSRTSPRSSRWSTSTSSRGRGYMARTISNSSLPTASPPSRSR